MQGAQAHWLPDGRRLHLNHGPIDLIVEAFGAPNEVRAAYEQAVARFETVLGELVEELPELRRPTSLGRPRDFSATTARRMEAAVAPLAEKFLTPMAAVAGSVADEILAALVAGRTLERAYINNGGDIALHLATGQEISVAVAGTGHGLADRLKVRADDPVRGIATSGWRGRSFSRGIADAVTVLARTGAQADAAATVIANAVDLPGHEAIERRPARELAPDNDLCERLVTVGVGDLTFAEIEMALARGASAAEDLCRRGLIEAAALFLTGESRVCGRFGLGPLGSADKASSHSVQHPSSDLASRGHLLPQGEKGERYRIVSANLQHW
jgi:ApbE superfamily uncharacterized protein (UPF0280 family)